MGSLSIIRVYLDIFLELLWSTHCVTKLVIFVRCIKTSANYLSNSWALPMAQLRTTSLGISMGHERVSSGPSSTRKDSCGVRLSPWRSWRPCWSLGHLKIAKVTWSLIGSWSRCLTLCRLWASWGDIYIRHILSRSITFKVRKQILASSTYLITWMVISRSGVVSLVPQIVDKSLLTWAPSSCSRILNRR